MKVAGCYIGMKPCNTQHKVAAIVIVIERSPIEELRSSSVLQETISCHLFSPSPTAHL
jgi:hypothetical protein